MVVEVSSASMELSAELQLIVLVLEILFAHDTAEYSQSQGLDKRIKEGDETNKGKSGVSVKPTVKGNEKKSGKSVKRETTLVRSIQNTVTKTSFWETGILLLVNDCYSI